MYSQQTYEVIKQRILDNIDNDIDKREGSLTNTMVSPISVELTQTYMEFEHILNLLLLF